MDSIWCNRKSPCILYMSHTIHRPIPRRPTSNNLVGLDTTQHGDTTSTSTRNRLPVETQQRQERSTPGFVRVSTGTKQTRTPNTATALYTSTKKKAGGKRKKRKTQKKRKSTKKRNNKKKQ